jgi:hypothetical protein
LKRLLPLAVIEVFVWLVLLLSTLIISKVAFAIDFGDLDLVHRAATNVARVFVSGLVVLIWLLVWKKVTDFYFWRTVGRRGASS